MLAHIHRLLIRLGVNNGNKRVGSPVNRQNAKTGNNSSVSQTIINNNFHGDVPAPELFMRIYGNGAMQAFDCTVSNRSGKMVTLDEITIAGEVMSLNECISRNINLGDLTWPRDVFINPIGGVPVTLTYHPLDGTNRHYRYSVQGKQVLRQDGRYNIEFPDPYTVEQLA